jgi:hypothetical protein
LIIPLLLFGSLLVTPVKDTVWWDTPGGRVTEHRDPAGTSCSLMLYDAANSVVFEWDKPDRTFVTVTNQQWQIPDESAFPVLMRLGDVWIGNGEPGPILPAVRHGNAFSTVITQSVDELLPPADRIEVVTSNEQWSMRLNQAKIGTLLPQARRCRDVIRR